MPDYRSCRRCRTIFDYRGNPLCPACIHEKDEVYTRVRDYLYEKPNANVTSIVEEVGVDKDLVLELLRDGSLELRSVSEQLSCQRCGKPIAAGRMCATCSAGLRRELEGVKKSMMSQPVETLKEPGTPASSGSKWPTSVLWGFRNVKPNDRNR